MEPKYQPGDRVITVKEAPYFDAEAQQIGTERLKGTVKSSRPLPDGTYLYYVVTDIHGLIPEREDQIEPLTEE